MRVGVNTYGLGSLFETDFEGTLERLRKIGFDFIEPCVLFEDALSIPEERMREHLRKLGISDAGIWSSKEAGEKIEQVRNKGFDVTGAHVMLSPMLGCSMGKGAVRNEGGWQKYGALLLRIQSSEIKDIRCK